MGLDSSEPNKSIYAPPKQEDITRNDNVPEKFYKQKAIDKKETIKNIKDYYSDIKQKFYPNV